MSKTFPESVTIRWWQLCTSSFSNTPSIALLLNELYHRYAVILNAVYISGFTSHPHSPSFLLNLFITYPAVYQRALSSSSLFPQGV